MKVLAVIPARAGSKGIPNKNLRILAGKPLVQYAIENAINCELIDDVIVTTDSPEVRLIAWQLGADVLWRKDELCKDDVTLDSVVFDAVPSESAYDYVVTMQPTSPTLKLETLTQAIERAVNENLDTLISVVNDTRLSWKKDAEGRITPNYAKRLNRQWLPPEFAETGAFVISKAGVVTEASRIGQSVDVFEVSANEAIDIDTFDDLILAQNHLEEKKVAICANGNNEIGLGHVYRALELADEFNSKPTIFFDKNVTEAKLFGSTTHNLVGVDSKDDLVRKIQEGQFSLVINDVLDTTESYMKSLREAVPNAKIVNFEDSGSGRFFANATISALYESREENNSFAGEDYYIAPKSFLFLKPIEIQDKVKNVFVCFGGADPQNYTEQVLSVIQEDEEFCSQYNFTFVLGRAKENASELMKMELPCNIEVFYDVSCMPNLMIECDAALTSRGRTAYELASLGVPTISIAQNKREQEHTFVCEENGFIYLGIKPPKEVLRANLKMLLKMSKKARQQFQEKLLSHDLRNGRARVMKVINNL